ncbi:MAG: sigma-54-dependent Fis family transcriptional regulator [Planctomycetes bacterium]|nr:sigma-54-dependent Fis family transcriptional regulator [Planctomycetota bacterium]
MNLEPGSPRVLLVDDDDTFRQVMSSELSQRGYEVTSAATGGAALDQAVATRPDVILLDLRLPDMEGIQVLQDLRQRDLAGSVIVLTGHGTIDTAIQAIRLGAQDFLEKPSPIEKVEMAIRKTYEHQRLQERQRVLEDGYSLPQVGLQLIGRSSAFLKLRQTIDRIAPTDSTTLILGETGVGKEMVAKLLHALSPRKERPFVVVDCAALHEDLLLSEIFGHEKGAFTGASRQKHGLFEVADTGTLFLDEVGDTSPKIQAQLLRVLETGRFRRLGGTTEIATDVRLISATNRDLSASVSRGHFREDLFFRLSTMTLEIPPLRERVEDIGVLVDHFTRHFNARFSLAKRFGPDALGILLRYGWPGNVRELVHVVEQVVALGDKEEIQPEDLPRALRAASRGLSGRTERLPLEEVKRRHVLSVLESVRGNKVEAARILGVSARNLYRLLEKYGAP